MKEAVVFFKMLILVLVTVLMLTLHPLPSLFLDLSLGSSVHIPVTLSECAEGPGTELPVD